MNAINLDARKNSTATNCHKSRNQSNINVSRNNAVPSALGGHHIYKSKRHSRDAANESAVNNGVAKQKKPSMEREDKEVLCRRLNFYFARERVVTVTKDRDDANKKVESAVGKLEIVKKERDSALEREAIANQKMMEVYS
jgi:hypothetical protein